jgi:hypothetical protein
MSLAYPLCAACFVLSRSRRLQVASGILAGLLGLTLLGTNSWAGWMAVLLVLVLLGWLAIRKGATSWWKRLGILVLVGIVEFGVLNYASSGSLVKRAGEPMADVEQVMASGMDQGNTNGPLIQVGTQENLAERLIRKYGKAASGRGYIWIRSLQMAGDTILFGRGPDTFALYFPNADPYKAFYSQPNTFIDKPHNLYLQLWLNLGGLATLAFLAMVFIHGIHTFRILKRADISDERTMLAVGLFLGWSAYLLAGFFYDSTVSVAATFWIVFGLGMAMNEIVCNAGNPGKMDGGNR